jgi:hypothetical protein
MLVGNHKMALATSDWWEIAGLKRFAFGGDCKFFPVGIDKWEGSCYTYIMRNGQTGGTKWPLMKLSRW